MNTKLTLRKNANDFLTHTRKHNGITLIALVITIIVLLILAGITISTLTGDNGILKQAVNAKEKTKRAQVKELVGLMYNEAMMNENATKDKIMEKIVEELTEQGYKVKEEASETMTIVGMNIENNTETMVIESSEGGAKTVNITLETSLGNSSKKYVEINEKYYEITVNSEGVKIATEATEEISGSEPRTDLVKASIDKSEIADVSVTGSTSTNYTLKITPKEQEGSAKITLTVEGTEIIKTIDITIKTLKKEGTVTIGGEKITKDNVAEYLGKKVTNYTGASSVIINGETYEVSTEYRLYYIDFEGKYGEKDTIYLKAECTDKNYMLPITDTTSADETKIKELNPELYKDGNAGPDASNDNMKAVTWLTNTTNWKSLADKKFEGDINYIVGAPSIEMMMDSYNTHYKLTGTEVESSGSNRIKLLCKYEQGLDGYKVWSSGYYEDCGEGITTYLDALESDPEIDSTYYPGDYGLYWFGSPSFCDGNGNTDSPSVLLAYYDNGGIVIPGGILTEECCALCPLVSLKSSAQLTLED